MAERPFTFGEIQQAHKRLRDTPGYKEMDLSGFSKYLNQATGSQLFDAGLNDTWGKRTSAFVDRVFDPVAQPMGEIGAGVMKAIAPKYEDLGEQIGESIPRSIAEIGAQFASGPVGIMSKIAGTASAGLRGYAETDSKLAGAISGAGVRAMPWAAFTGMKQASKVGQKLFYDGLAKKPGQGPLTGIVEKAIEYTGANLGMAVADEVAAQGSGLAAYGLAGLQSPLTPEWWITRVGAQVPFAVVDLPFLLRKPNVAPGPGGREFRSYTEAEMAGQAAQALATQAKEEAARRVDAILKTQQREEPPLPPAKPKTGEERKAKPISQEMADAGLFGFREADPNSVWALFENSEASEARLREIVLAGETVEPTFVRNLLARLGQKDLSQVDDMLQRWEQIGFVGPIGPDGSRPVIGQSWPTKDALIAEALQQFAEGLPPVQGDLFSGQAEHGVRASLSFREVQARTANVRGAPPEPGGSTKILEARDKIFETRVLQERRWQQLDEARKTGQQTEINRLQQEINAGNAFLAELEQVAFAPGADEIVRKGKLEGFMAKPKGPVEFEGAPPPPLVKEEPGTVVKMPEQTQSDREAKQLLAQGQEIDQLVAQFMERFSVTAGRNMSLRPVPASQAEVTVRAQQLVDELTLLLNDATAGLSPELNTRPFDLGERTREYLNLGMTPVEAANRVYNSVMRQLAKQVRALQHLIASRPDWHTILGEEPAIVERLKKLNELPESYQRTIYEVMQEPYFVTGKGRTFEHAPYIMAAAVAFHTLPNVKHAQIMQQLVRLRDMPWIKEEAVRQVALSERKTPPPPPRDATPAQVAAWNKERLSVKYGKKELTYEQALEEQVELAALRSYIRKAGAWSTSKPEIAQQMLQERLMTEADPDFTGKEHAAPEVSPYTEEQIDAAAAAGVALRAQVGRTGFNEIVWSIAGERATPQKPPLKSTRKGMSHEQRFNLLLEMFQNNHMGFVPDKASPSGKSLKFYGGSKELAAKFGLSQDATVRYANDDFLPRLLALPDAIARVEARGAKARLPTQPLMSTNPQGVQAQAAPPNLAEIAKQNNIDPNWFRRPLGDEHVSMAVQASVFFKSFFNKTGMSDAQVQQFTDVAVRVALLYQGVGYVRIGQIVDPQVLGLAARPDDVGMVMLNKQEMLQTDFFNKDTVGFAANYIAAHELWHIKQLVADMSTTPTAEMLTVKSAERWANSLSPEERGALTNRFFRAMVPETHLRPGKVNFATFIEHRTIENRTSPVEFMADTAGLVALGIAAPDTKTKVRVNEFLDELLFTDDHAAQFAKGLYLDLHDMVQGLQAYFTFALPNIDRAQFSNALTNIKSSLASLSRVDRAAATLARLQEWDPVNYLKMVSEARELAPVERWEDVAAVANQWQGSVEPARVRAMLNDAGRSLGVADRAQIEKDFGIEPSWWEKLGQPSAQLSATYPHLQKTFDLVRSFRALANDNLVRILAPFLTKTTKMGRPELDYEGTGLAMLADNPDVDAVATDISLRMQEAEASFTEAEMREMMPPGMPEVQKQAIIDFQRAADEAFPLAAALTIKFDYDNIVSATAAIFMGRDKKMTSDAAEALAKDFVAAARSMGEADPAVQAAAQATLKLVAEQAGTRAYNGAMQVANKLMELVDKKAAAISDKPWYRPELRLNKYMVAWKREDGKTGSRSFETKAEASTFKATLDGDPTVVSARAWDKYDRRQATSGMHPDLVQHYANIDDAAFNSALLANVDPEIAAEIRDIFSPGEAVLKEIRSHGVDRFFFKRKLAEGREYTSTTLSAVHYISGLSTGLAKRYTTDRIGLSLQDPSLRANPQLQQLAKDHFMNVLNPSAKELTLFKNLNFAYFLGFNLSSNLVELSQSVMTLVPQLTRDSGSLRSSYKYWGKAVTESVGAMIKGGKYADPELQAAVERAVREQRIDFGLTQELEEFSSVAIMNLRKLGLERGPLTKVADLMSKPLYHYLTTARWLYGKATRSNSYIAFNAAYRLGKEKLKLEGEALYNYAVRTVDVTMFGGGIAGRPVGLPKFFGGQSRSLFGILYSLQSFTFGTIGMMARFGKEAIGGRKDLTPAQRRAATKALGQMLFTQAAVTGVMGLPFLGSIIAMLEEFFPEVEAHKGLREAFAALAGDDVETGQLVSDIAMKGLPTATSGVDISSRMGLASFLGVSPYDGFSLANLIGPTGSIFENLQKGISAASVGQLGTAAEHILPNAYKNALQLYNDEFMLRDQAGRLLVEPTAVEATLHAIGLRSKRLADYREQQKLTRRTEEIHGAQQRRFHDEMSQLLLAGQAGEVQQRIRARQTDDKMYDPIAGARAIVQKAYDRTNPVDLSRSGARQTATERMRLQAMFGRQAPTEVDRLMQTNNLAMQLGMPQAARLSPQALYTAQIVDQLQSMNPLMSRQEALQMLEQMSAGPR